MKFFIYSLSLFLIFNCNKAKLEKNSIGSADEFLLKDSIKIQVLSFRAKVLKLSNSRYSLVLNKEDSDTILFYRPKKLKLILPFLNEKELVIQPRYLENEVSSEFIYKSGWIDSSELRGSFEVNDLNAWLVPIESIYSPFGKLHYVIKNINNKAELFKVNIISLNGRSVLILGKLNYGDRILKTKLGEAVQNSSIGVEL